MTHLLLPSYLCLLTNASRHTRTPCPSRTRRSWSGFSLVELMVAIVISSLLLVGVLQIFISSRESYKLDEGLSRIQENGRFATEFLEREIRMAGHMGCLANVQATNITNYLAGGGAPFDLSRPIEGFEAVNTNPTQTYNMAATYPTVALSTANTDWSPPLNAGLLPATKAVPGPTSSSSARCRATLQLWRRRSTLRRQCS